MIVTPIKTSRVLPNRQTLIQLMDEHIESIQEGSVLAITSKIVSLCEGSTVPLDQDKKDELIEQESDFFTPREESVYDHSFTILNNTLIAVAGIDESNSAGTFILWPRNPQETANLVRKYLSAKFGLKDFGVIITDSTSYPLRLGTKGICIAHSGFKSLNDYRGTKDLFDHTFEVSVANVSEGLAAASVLVMGEGTEQTPMALIKELPFVKFQRRDPTPEELKELKLTVETDLFESFLNNGKWQKGGRSKH